MVLLETTWSRLCSCPLKDKCFQTYFNYQTRTIENLSKENHTIGEIYVTKLLTTIKNSRYFSGILIYGVFVTFLTCNSLLCNKCSHHVKNRLIQSLMVIYIHCTLNRTNAIVCLQLVGKIGRGFVHHSQHMRHHRDMTWFDGNFRCWWHCFRYMDCQGSSLRHVLLALRLIVVHTLSQMSWVWLYPKDLKLILNKSLFFRLLISFWIEKTWNIENKFCYFFMMQFPPATQKADYATDS